VFDVLAAGRDGDVRGSSWEERAAILAERFPPVDVFGWSRRYPRPETHERLLRLGFEGSVLKRRASTYRPGRTRSRRKLKAAYIVSATIPAVDRDREARLLARCVLADGRRCSPWADARGANLVRHQVTIAFSRVDANGGLREPRPMSSAVTQRFPWAVAAAQP
jgi:hypothetical protein